MSTTNTSGKLAWGILSTGAIAKTFARNAAASKTGHVVAVASRSQEKADKFGDEFNIPKRYSSYEALLADPEVQAVYIAPPHPQHAEWAIKAAEAGKHLLVEKPLAVNYGEAMAIVEAARIHNVFLMEAFMYRCHPQTAKLVELLKEKVIGDIGVIQATFSFHAGFNPESRLWSSTYAGGGIMDVGCYAASMARLVAGVATGKPFADPISVTGAAKLNEVTKVDEYAIATLKFPGDILAQLSTGVGLNQENVVRIFGTGGSIFLSQPWVAGRETGCSSKIVVTKKGQKDPIEYCIDSQVTSYTLEMDTVANAIAQGRREAQSPAMSPDDTLGNIRTLDQWRQSAGG
jgi:predicted dehydrogenase